MVLQAVDHFGKVLRSASDELLENRECHGAVPGQRRGSSTAKTSSLAIRPLDKKAQAMIGPNEPEEVTG